MKSYKEIIIFLTGICITIGGIILDYFYDGIWTSLISIIGGSLMLVFSVMVLIKERKNKK